MGIGDNIRAVRIAHKMTQKDLADKLNVKQTAVSYWENGKREPDFDTIKRICHIFSMTYNELLDGNWDGYTEEIKEDFIEHNQGEISGHKKEYYIDEETAQLAQEMFDDPDIRALFHMKRNMDANKFKAHITMMKELYKLEHPEEFPEDDWN